MWEESLCRGCCPTGTDQERGNESMLVIWQSSKAVSRNCNILLQVWQHLMLLWLNHSYMIRILPFKVKIIFSRGLSLQGPKPRRRTKRTTLHDFKCLVGFSSDIIMVSDCLAAVKYETKRWGRTEKYTIRCNFHHISISLANSYFNWTLSILLTSVGFHSCNEQQHLPMDLLVWIRCNS